MNYCESCQQLEGNTVENEDGETICAECDEPITRVPEHDHDVER